MSNSGSQFQHVYSTHRYNEIVFCVDLGGEGAASSTDLELTLNSFTLTGAVPARLVEECRREVGGDNETSFSTPDERWIQKCCSPLPRPEGVAAEHYPLRLNVSRTRAFPRMAATWLREDPLYYNLYCLGLNTVFATAVPFLLLLYFNVSTVIALTRMGARVMIRMK